MFLKYHEQMGFSATAQGLYTYMAIPIKHHSLNPLNKSNHFYGASLGRETWIYKNGFGHMTKRAVMSL